MSIHRMYTGDDGESHIEELQPDDPKLASLGTVTGCSLQITQAGEFSDFHSAPPPPLVDHLDRSDRHRTC